MSYSNPGANIALAGYTNVIAPYRDTEHENEYDVHGGTSAAAPAISGVSALVLEALKSNPHLENVKWYDLLWTLISTANINLTNRDNYNDHYQGDIGGQARISKVKNAFGLTHSLDFGLGVPNVHKAIEMALSIKSTLPDMIDSQRFGYDENIQTIAPGNCAGQSININESMQIWSVHVSAALSGAPLRDIGIFLKMSDENLVMVKNTVQDDFPLTHYVNPNYVLTQGPTELSLDYQYHVRAPMGLNSKGTWEVKVCLDADASSNATFSAAEIQVHGFENPNALESVY